MNSHLVEIIARKKKEVEKLCHRPSFKDALTAPGLSVIAEIKRKSPSKGHISEIRDPVALAQSYQAGSASAISVLTDKEGFGGSLHDLSAVSAACPNMPVLRKDFIVHPLQLIESMRAGADAVLLIVAVLQQQTADFIKEAKRLHLDVLVEVHTEAELEIALNAEADIIGINNRNLNTFEVDLKTAEHLVKNIPAGIIKVAESGIKRPEDTRLMHELGFDAVLIGEALVQCNEINAFIRLAKGHHGTD